ncbi:hypothetical protein ONZ45_g3260 [Pleurotus djamor]|nr:hypothetical protein ONZ45_g3260 [Pleurotus djamor]
MYDPPDSSTLLRSDRNSVELHGDGDSWPLPPSMEIGIADVDMWRVNVKRGYETKIVVTIGRKAFDLSIPIANAFCRDEIPGCVYIQCTYTDGIAVLEGIHGVRLRRRQKHALIELVSFGDRVALLGRSTQRPGPSVASFVRIQNQSIYRDSLAYVHKIDPSSCFATVYLVPRQKNSTIHSSTKPSLARSSHSVHGESQTPEPITDENHIHGLEVRNVPFRCLRLTSIYPTDLEMSLFNSSPLSNFDPVFAHALKRLGQSGFEPGERAMVIGGPYNGLHGTILEVCDRYAIISTMLASEDGLFEVPLDHLLSYSNRLAAGSSVSVSQGPYLGLSGHITTLNSQYAIVEPSTSTSLQIDVSMWHLSRKIEVGEYVAIIEGENYGLSGFVVAVDQPIVEIYICDSVGQVEEPQMVCDLCMHVKPCATPSKFSLPETNVRLDATHLRKENFSGMEVYVKYHPTLKGLDGYIVGNRYERRQQNSRLVDVLVCEVNPGIKMTSFTTPVDAEFLYEKYTKLPIVKAVHLPRVFRRPVSLPPPRTTSTPPPPKEETWSEIIDKTPEPPSHSAMRGRKCEVVIEGTTGIIGGAHATIPYRGGRYEGHKGYTVIPEEELLLKIFQETDSRTLRSLLLVSKAIYAVAEPLLFEEVILPNVVALALFHRTLIYGGYRKPYVRRFCLVLSAEIPLPKTLAIGLEALLAGLKYLASPSLKKLLIYLPSPTYASTMRAMCPPEELDARSSF